MGAVPELHDLIAAFTRALNAKDADSLGQLFSEDAVFVSIRGAQMHGRQEIIDGHALAFAGPLAGRTFRVDSIEELPVTTNVTVVHALGVNEPLPDAASSTEPTITTVFQLVARQEPNGWQAIAAANILKTPLSPPDAPST